VALGRALRLFLKYLYRQGHLQCSAPQETDSGGDSYLCRDEGYPRNDHGLADNSVHVYLPFIRDFLSAQTFQADCLTRDAIETLNIRNFLLARTKGRSDEYTRFLATSLRSFFRFLFFAGEADLNLSSSVPMVQKYRMSAPPSFLSPEQTERVLAARDRTTSTGRRD
jgi:site-specific recombinase XerD